MAWPTESHATPKYALPFSRIPSKERPDHGSAKAVLSIDSMEAMSAWVAALIVTEAVGSLSTRAPSAGQRAIGRQAVDRSWAPKRRCPLDETILRRRQDAPPQQRERWTRRGWAQSSTRSALGPTPPSRHRSTRGRETAVAHAGEESRTVRRKLLHVARR